MAQSEEFWNNLYLAFNPYETLVGERSNRLYCTREHSPFEEMKQIFRRTLQFPRPPIAFFSGHRGSGKSSLLFRLLEHCQTDFFVAYFDIEYNLDMGKANQIDLLYLIGTAIFQAAVQEGFAPNPKNLEELHKSVYTITNTEKETPVTESVNVVELAKNLLVFSAGVLGSKVGEKLAEAILKPFTITSGVSEEIARKREIEPQVQKIVTNINFIIADVQKLAGKPVLVIVDGLDKIQRLEQAKLIFLESRALMGPICRIIYTVPMLIQTIPEFIQATQDCKRYPLPNVKLYEKYDSKRHYEPGYATMREVFTKRLDTIPAAQGDIFEPDVLDYLIEKSGGVMRWFIALVQDSCAVAERMNLDKVNHAAAQQAVEAMIADLTEKLTIERKAELVRVHKEHLPSNSPESNELLHALFIVAYRNGETWFDAHPLLWEMMTP